jgi:hypothetical protein
VRRRARRARAQHALARLAALPPRARPDAAAARAAPLIPRTSTSTPH